MKHHLIKCINQIQCKSLSFFHKCFPKTLFLVFCLSGCVLSSQAQVTMFEKQYGTAAKNEYGRDATILTNNAGYAITGWANKSSTNKDIYFLRTDTCGRENLSRTYGGNDDDMAYEIRELANGNLTVVGETENWGSGVNDAYLMRMTGSTFGAAQGRAIGDTSIDVGMDFKQLAGGGMVVTGYTHRFSGKENIFLAKFNSSLTAQWIYRLGGTQDDRGNAVLELSGGDFIIAGATKSYGMGNWDHYLIRTNSSGIVSWAKTYGTTNYDVTNNVKTTLDGGLIMVGTTKNSNNSGNSLFDIQLIKTTSAGTLQWTKSYGGLQDEMGEDVIQLADSSYIVVGYTKSFGAGDWDVYMFKVDKNGNTVWARTFGGTSEDQAFSVEKTADNGFVLGGHTNSFGPGNFDVYVMKTNSLGFTGCNDSSGINTYAPHDSVINAYVQDSLLYVINGASVDTFTTIDSTHCSTCNPARLLDHNHKEQGMLLYPNPANESINVEIPFTGSEQSFDVRVYSSYGTLVHEEKVHGSTLSSVYKINSSDWETGMYVVVISSSEGWLMNKATVTH